MFLQKVKVKAFARNIKKHGRFPEEWKTIKFGTHRVVGRVENQNPDDIYTIIGKTRFVEGYTEYLGYEEGVTFNGVRHVPVYVVAKNEHRSFKVLLDDIEIIQEG